MQKKEGEYFLMEENIILLIMKMKKEIKKVHVYYIMTMERHI
jgi:hypothetical protein